METPSRRTSRVPDCACASSVRSQEQPVSADGRAARRRPQRGAGGGLDFRARNYRLTAPPRLPRDVCMCTSSSRWPSEHTEGSPSAARASGGAQAGGTDVQTLAGADAGGHRPLRDETVAEFESAAQVGAQLNKMEGKAATTGDVEACGGMRGSSSAPSAYCSCAGAVAAPASIGAETGADFACGPQICVFHHNMSSTRRAGLARRWPRSRTGSGRNGHQWWV